MRNLLIAAALATTAVAIPVIAQNMPTEAPGKADPALVKAGTYSIDPSHAQIGFTVRHFGFNDYFGLFGSPKGTLTLDPANPAKAAVSVEIPLSAIATSSEGLTTHLKKPEFFDVEKFPTATFKSTSVAVSGTSAKIAGTLTIKGVTKPVTLDAQFVGAGTNPFNKKDTIGFSATTKLKRSDFGVSYGIPLVTDEVDLKISVAFEKQA
ncbi:hypothetical protein CLG96_13245 [Sphingomonas oleivorans]|uniref:Lipid/polyisoprenoid-binding YceI-like domain-containing protein n=1 Tax=Sphingomonas oleivorans TaxID=1735121 RepID=A0A2T5FWE5_9SPHN|nr:YceI family protein [Sphingomonas oleivorans]PTQ10096.1 hypothetical protein CLG96_13245 [Sphingomonas oleivorans]